MIEEFKEEGIIREGHFLLTSGRHSNLYIDKDRIFRSKLFPSVISALTSLIRGRFSLREIDVIVGPAVAGAILAVPVWHEIQNRAMRAFFKQIYFVYPEKIDGEMVFRRGYDKFLQGKNVLIVEDIITTGKSVAQTATAIYKCGGNVKGAICIWNRTDWTNPYFPIASTINKKVESWEPEKCPLCYLNEIPLTNPKE